MTSLTLGERLKSLRQSKKLSLGKLEKEVNIAASTLGDYENDNKNPTIDRLKRLASFYKVSLDYLADFSEYEADDNTLISKQILLSSKSLDFLKECPPSLLISLDKLLSDPFASDFILEFMTYVYAINNADKTDAADVLAYKLANAGTSLSMPETGEVLKELQWRKVAASLQKIAENIANECNEKEAADDGKHNQTR